MKIIFRGDINCFARHEPIHYLILYIRLSTQKYTGINSYQKVLEKSHSYNYLFLITENWIPWYEYNFCQGWASRWISWTMCLISSLSHSWGNFKFFSLSFLRYFGLIISFIWLIIYFIYFFLCSDIYPIPAIFLILWWEIGAISSFLVYQSYFHGMSQPQKSLLLQQ